MKRRSKRRRNISSSMPPCERRSSALPEAAKIKAQVDDLTPKIQALNDPFQEVRSHIGALTYETEVTNSESGKESLRKKIEELKAETHKVKLPGGETREMNFPAMDQQLKDWKDQKAALLQQNVEVMAKANALRKQRDQYLSDRIADASTVTLDAVDTSLSKFDIRIRQIHIKDIDLVDRCESCHLGTREPVVITAAAMGGQQVFASHPNKELLKIHDPESFGCTPCHGGNGVALSSVEKAHGYNKYWLWPLHHKENIEAGCQQCHVKEIVTEMADTLNAGREIFRLRGCTGCHRYEGFDREADEISSVNQQIHQDDQQKAEWAREIVFTRRESEQSQDQQRRSQEALRSRQRSARPFERPRCQNRTARHAICQSRSRSQESRSQPERSSHEAPQGMDPGVAERSA